MKKKSSNSQVAHLILKYKRGIFAFLSTVFTFSQSHKHHSLLILRPLPQTSCKFQILTSAHLASPAQVHFQTSSPPFSLGLTGIQPQWSEDLHAGFEPLHLWMSVVFQHCSSGYSEHAPPLRPGQNRQGCVCLWERLSEGRVCWRERQGRSCKVFLLWLLADAGMSP